jgi:hypothetical protein
MTAGHGRSGSVYMDITGSGSAAKLPGSQNWMVNFTAKRDEVTAFGDANNHYVQGLPDGSGSCDLYWDNGTHQAYTAAQDGTARKTYLYPTTPSSAGPYWYGTFFWDFSVTTDVGKAVLCKSTFAPATDYVKIGS